MEPKTVGRRDGIIPNTRPTDACRGITPGTQILTLDGALPVEVLVPGDKVITRNCGLVFVKAIEHQTVTGDAVHIRAGSLGHDRPGNDTLLPADQTVLIRDWRAQALFGEAQAEVPLRRLVDGEFLQLKKDCEITVFRLYFETPQILYADGLELCCDSIQSFAERLG